MRNGGGKEETFFSKFKFQRFRKGEVLIRPDDNPAGVFYLKQGMVKRYGISPNGQELDINIYKVPFIFPIAWALNDMENPHYYEAVTEVEVWRAPREDVVKFFKENPEEMFKLLTMMTRALENCLIRIGYLLSSSAHIRVMNGVQRFASRFGVSRGEKVIVKFKLTEKDIAFQIGIARETVSKELQKLKKGGLIDYEKNQLIINNIRELETELLSS